MFIVFIYFAELKWLGIVYFFVELAVILGVVLIERTVAKKTTLS